MSEAATTPMVAAPDPSRRAMGYGHVENAAVSVTVTAVCPTGFE
jgi:hypothetical protein